MGEDAPVTIGIALGSGSARGWAHIGVLEALAEAGVRPAIVCGASVGALVGGAYASGYMDEFARWIRSLRRLDVVRMLDVTVRGGGFIEGSRLMGILADRIRDVRIEELRSPRFAAVATELATGHERWFHEGSLLQAIRASIALPGLFTPVQGAAGRWLVDGGLVNPVPVSVCRAMGADIVIAVNLNGDLVTRSRNHGRPVRHVSTELTGATPNEDAGGTRRADPAHEVAAGRFRWNIRNLISLSNSQQESGPGLFDVLSASINIMQDRITRSRMAGDPPDLVISPRLAHLGLMEFHRGPEAIAEGRAAVERMGSALEHLLGSRVPAPTHAQEPPNPS
ncbi:MAG TPA: patatin-like phospholipase family protein [Gammaproteobacteria bacterium]|nr:patatin-like phospholipase family protein [Gammaproteobacteria bacterium]